MKLKEAPVVPEVPVDLAKMFEFENMEQVERLAHNPEPLPKNLVELSETVVKTGADLGISVDPDVDRLAFICENGEPFVEEYTLVAVADYLLERAEKQGVSPLNTVSNLSSITAISAVGHAKLRSERSCLQPITM